MAMNNNKFALKNIINFIVKLQLSTILNKLVIQIQAALITYYINLHKTWPPGNVANVLKVIMFIEVVAPKLLFHVSE